jgi:hypothetical protein
MTCNKLPAFDDTQATAITFHNEETMALNITSVRDDSKAVVLRAQRYEYRLVLWLVGSLRLWLIRAKACNGTVALGIIFES